MDHDVMDVAPQDEAPRQRRVWETPELIVESVESVTRGGSLGTTLRGDDAFYIS